MSEVKMSANQTFLKSYSCMFRFQTLYVFRHMYLKKCVQKLNLQLRTVNVRNLNVRI